MTETTMTTHPAEAKIHPSEVLMRVIIAILTPAFLTVCEGDETIARLAALETIKQYNPRSHVDLIVIAQVIACGLASAASVGLSFRADLSASMTLRLRANAAALARVADRAARTLDKPIEQPARQHPDPDIFTPEDAEYEAKVIAEVAASTALVDEAIARYKAARTAPVAAPARAQTPPPAPVQPDEQWDDMWANVICDAAEEAAAGLANLPPEAREEAARTAAMLSDVAHEVFSRRASANAGPNRSA